MGRRYEFELQKLETTYHWARGLDLGPLTEVIGESIGSPMYVIGSGGSLSAAHFVALLHEAAGCIALARTPLEFVAFPEAAHDSTVLLLSARGRNSDIVSCLRMAAESEPRQLAVVCLSQGSPLGRMARAYQYPRLYEYSIPTGKDGFLATNSLVAFAALLYSAYANALPGEYRLPERLPSGADVARELRGVQRNMLDRDTWIVLYSSWGKPAAVDIESKFSEAALGHVQIVDYRNFAHGRHNWLTKRGSETGVVLLITPDSRELAERTRALIPVEIPTLTLTARSPGPSSAVELLVKVLHLVRAVGQHKHVDPGMPKVPSYGRKIYHLGMHSVGSGVLSAAGTRSREDTAVTRKVRSLGLPPSGLSDEVQVTLRKAYRRFVRALSHAEFGCVIMDYDGTLCSSDNRLTGPTPEVYGQMERLLGGGIIIGIATGRGKSVREDLRRVLAARYWTRVIVGYYNGSDIAALDDDLRPDAEAPPHGSVCAIDDALRRHPFAGHIAEWETRPAQISVKPVDPMALPAVRTMTRNVVAKHMGEGVRLLESGHSQDVLAVGVSKLALVDACQSLTTRSGAAEDVLCIGDRGRWPGNDVDLLSTPFSLSVGEVSPDPGSCWNLARSGRRDTDATLQYLSVLQIIRPGAFVYKPAGAH